ncbi:MAG: T9SS type A sorting domain-containing protein [Saprospiraceae bacterium]|nr:T9SS type A sorting domain-containing protein [Saprospiraceae bacterium]
MKSTFILIISLLLLFSTSFSQTFMKSYGGQYHELARDIIETPDGDFVMVGNTQSYSNGNYDIWVVKVNSSGDTIWTRNYGGANPERAASITLMSDSNYLIAGNTNSYGQDTPSSSNYYLLKLNQNGDTIWTWHHNNYGNDELYHAIATSDNGFLLCGWKYYSGYAKGAVMKLDSARNVVWTQYIPSSANSHAFEAYEEANGNYVVTATSLGGTFNVFLRRYTPAGYQYLPTTFHSGGSYADAGLRIIPAHNGGYMIAGVYGNYGTYNLWLLRVGNNLDTIWNKLMPGVFSISQMWLKDISIAKTSDGYVLCGKYLNGAAGYDMKLIKTDTLGNILWTKFYGTPYDDAGIKIITTSDNRIAACGYDQNNLGQQNFMLVVTDSAGNLNVISPPTYAQIYTASSISICQGDSAQLKTISDPTYTYNWYKDSVLMGFNDSIIWAKDSGSYWVEICVGGICSDSSQKVIVGFYNTPNIDLGADTIICQNSSITLNAGSGFGSYLWSTSDTTQFLTINASTYTPGSYDFYVTGIDNNGCYASDTIKIAISICSEIFSADENNKNIRIYPNPAKDEINFNLNGISFSQELRIEIYNSLGEKVKEVSSLSLIQNQTINISELDNGVYYLKIIDNDEILNKGKFVKVK